MALAIFSNVTETEKNTAIEAIIQHASPRQDFFLMLTLSIAMASFGVLLGSIVILIGSMLIAPLLYPVISLALGVIVSDQQVIGRALYTIGKSFIYAIVAAFVIGFFFSGVSFEVTLPLVDVVATGAPSLMYVLVAIIAGLTGTFAIVKPHLNETLPGIAIAVALVPPLAVAGLALSNFDWEIFRNAVLLFAVNAIGIMASAMVVFSLFHFSIKRTVTKEAVKEEQEAVEKEEDTSEEN